MHTASAEAKRGPAPRFALNTALSEVELAMGRAFLESMPRYMTIVLGNGCNIDCPHCYQLKNGDNLLRNAGIGAELRREFMSMYPCLETLRIQGGEVFALKGFRELLDDVTATVRRPLVSVSTNGTLLDDDWARRIVAAPFSNVTFSFDAGTKATFERLRRGARFETVVDNVRRLQALKRAASSWYPNIDAFYVVMRSNFREIPAFLDLMEELQIFEVSFQTMLTDSRNLEREPGLTEEIIREEGEIRELHAICEEVMLRRAQLFDRIAWSGLTSLFTRLGLNPEFLEEGVSSLYTDCRAARRKRVGPKPPPRSRLFDLPEIPAAAKSAMSRQKQCPNPWTTMFVTENGDVSICFLSEPVGNLYEQPLIEIWNGPKAIAKRSRMLAGRYTESGCSKLWCDWRDGKTCNPPEPQSWQALLGLFENLHRRLAALGDCDTPEIPGNLKAYRRLLVDKERRILELESNLKQMWDDNAGLHAAGRTHIQHLETKVEELLACVARTEAALEAESHRATLAETELHCESRRATTAEQAVWAERTRLLRTRIAAAMTRIADRSRIFRTRAVANPDTKCAPKVYATEP